jgi:hypothetical protein
MELHPVYSCVCRGNQFAIIRWKYTTTGASGTVIEYFQTIALAKRRQKELNMELALRNNPGIF